MSDWQLMNLLYLDGSRSITDLSRDATMSRQSVARKLRDFESSEYITYTILENPNHHDYRNFFIEIKTNPEEPEIVKELLKIPGIATLDGIIGTSSLMVRFQVRNARKFSDVLERIDTIVARTRFQHYKIIECIKTFKQGGVICTGWHSGQEEPRILDEIDVSIINILKAMSTKFTYETVTSELEMKSGIQIAYSTVRRRIKALVRDGFIKAFSIKIQPRFIHDTDFPLKFFLQLIPKDLSRYNSMAAGMLAHRQEIVDLYRTGEEFGLLAVVRTGNVLEYRKFLESLYNSREIQDSISTLVIDERLPSTFLPFKKVGK
ncbi:hypothetical protein GF325_02490 [Candidatus Bathyarchaeota archaeon]|nr:hypothetical protein [Candidatus Bathyarchaeota archaeon]